MSRVLGNMIYDVLDHYTGEQVVFERVTVGYDGNTITVDNEDTYIDGIIYKKTSRGWYVRRVIPDNKINVRWFGVRGDGSTDDTDNFIRAASFCLSSGYSMYFPKGVYNLTSFQTSDLGVVSNTLSFVGDSPNDVTIVMPDDITFIGDLYLSGIRFRGSLSEYLFRYDTSGIPSPEDDPIYKNIQIENCVFEECKRCVSVFHTGHINAPQNLIFKGYVSDCVFNSVGEGGIMVRALLQGFTAFNNTFDGINNPSTYVFCLSLGDTGFNNSSGVIIAYNKFLNISPIETSVDDSTYVVIVYGAANEFIGNSFHNCTRGVYSRGNAGLVFGNQFYNDTVIGTFPIIFKAGTTGEHKAINNSFFGKYNRLILHDSSTCGMTLSENKGTIECADGGENNALNLINNVSGGNYTISFERNNFIIQKDVTKNTLAISSAIKALIVTGNTIDTHWSTGSGGQFISFNNADSKIIIIKDNPYLSVDTLLYSQASLKIIENNHFFQKTYFNGTLFYRSNGGTIERIKGNSFHKIPGETYATNTPFNLLFRFFETTTAVIEDNYSEVAPSTGLIYATNDTDIVVSLKYCDLGGGPAFLKTVTPGSVTLNIIRCENYTIPTNELVTVNETPW